jgi:hypothetical protein
VYEPLSDIHTYSIISQSFNGILWPIKAQLSTKQNLYVLVLNINNCDLIGHVENLFASCSPSQQHYHNNTNINHHNISIIPISLSIQQKPLFALRQ